MFTLTLQPLLTPSLRRAVFPLIGLAALTGHSFANEGMWQPHQLPDLSDQLRQPGLKIDPENLSRLNQFPMNAVVGLGASFVSPQELVVTNHHCVYGSVQYNSTPENNLLVDARHRVLPGFFRWADGLSMMF